MWHINIMKKKTKPPTTIDSMLQHRNTDELQINYAK